jgi:hypothetical protein
LPTDAELPNFVNARFDRRWLITLRT